MESQTTEYKQQWSDKYLAYISGFANAPRNNKTNKQFQKTQPMPNEIQISLKLPQIVQTTSAQNASALFVQPETAQIGDEIVHTASVQLPKTLYLSTFSNHIEILNQCHTIEQQRQTTALWNMR